LKERLRKIFAEKEIYFRSHGKVHFLRISARVQIAAAALCAALLTAWLIATLIMLWGQIAVAQDRANVDAKARSVAAEASKVNAYKRSVSDIAAELDRRQDALDDMVHSQFGPAGSDPAVVGAPDDKTRIAPQDAANTDNAKTDKLSEAAPGIGALRMMEQRQTRFARRLAALINQRAARAEAAIRSFGLNPQQIAARAASAGQGGPYIPWSENDRAQDPAFTQLANAFVRLNALERGLASIPSGRPTASPMLTSSYGYRRDPFNGHAAFHAGVDFPGAYGQPILAAAAGRVAYVGRRQGYGNVVEIDHGHGIMTRYAHLSGFAVRPGQDVTRGFAIARMGSTGRSTGTHLHFEVRVNGAPINPRRFLEVKEDVLKVQQIAKQRVANVRRKTGQSGERG
tara:strand:+ start:36653 stop:37849 length:1197 start_codon:yes stop_codon:yes gene_type:complete